MSFLPISICLDSVMVSVKFDTEASIERSQLHTYMTPKHLKTLKITIKNIQFKIALMSKLRTRPNFTDKEILSWPH